MTRYLNHLCLHACALILLGAALAANASGLALKRDHHWLVIEGEQLPHGEIRLNYLEAYCRAGSTDADWVKDTVIPHEKEFVSLSVDGRVMKLRDKLADGVVVEHTITASGDEVDFRVVAHNPTDRVSEAQWAQPCVRLGAFTGFNPDHSKGDIDDYLSKCFIFLDGELARMPTAVWSTKARYMPGQVWAPADVPRTDVNPRPLNPRVPSNGLIGCFSGDDSLIFATAWEPYQELFQGVARCLHSDFRIGGLQPGETKTVRGKIYLVKNDVPALLKRYESDFPEQAVKMAVSNPVLDGADPHAIVVGETVWVYPTWSDDRRGHRFFAFSSTNLTDWERHGPILDFKDIDWIGDDGSDRHFAWAPGVLEKDGKWYFYYSVGPQTPTASRIGVAVGDSPAGPFRDSGKPLPMKQNGFEAIDPMAFTDPKSGKTYLYAGGSAGAKLRLFEMSPDLVTFAREIPVETPPQFTEGAFMHFANGRYYLSYSHGGWRDSSYSVHYATSDSPTGPWKYQGAILTSDATRKGPGHHSFINDPRTGDLLIVYHRWNNQTGDGPYNGSRQTCIDRVEYDEHGLIKPVVMTGR